MNLPQVLHCNLFLSLLSVRSTLVKTNFLIEREIWVNSNIFPLQAVGCSTTGITDNVCKAVITVIIEIRHFLEFAFFFLLV